MKKTFGRLIRVNGLKNYNICMIFTIISISLIPSLTFAQPTQESGDLNIKISNIVSAMPGDFGDEYVDPNVNEINTWHTILSNLIAGDYIASDNLAASISYDLIEFLDTSGDSDQTYYILENLGTNYWGTYVFNPNYCRSLVIQSPHSIKEYNTGPEGIHVFIQSESMFFCLNGTSRCNSTAFSTCDGVTSMCSVNAENYRLSDIPHNPASIWQKTTEYLFDNFSNTYFIQLHGFTKGLLDPYVIMSNGTAITPSPDYIVALWANLKIEDIILTFQIAHVNLLWTRLRAFSNTQGRYINSSADVCNTDATTTTGRFIHIEQEKTRLRDDISGWNKMANAVINTFPCYLVWDGSEDANWNTAVNWRKNTVPTSTDNVSITNIGNQMIVDESTESPAQCNYLEILSNATVNINPGKALTVYGDFNNSGSLTISSNASQTGSMIVDGEISGEVNIERYIAGWTNNIHGWHFLSSPVKSQAINIFHTPGSGNDFYKWDESNQIWINRSGQGGVLNGDFETDFTAGCGYFMANSTNSIKTFTGTPGNSDVELSNLSYTELSANCGWHLLGNPYSSALQWNKTNWELSNIDAIAKIWDESIASYTDIEPATGIIPAMQGFMIHANAAPGSLTIDATDRTHSSTNWYKSEDAKHLELTAYDVEGNSKQVCLIKVNPNATSGFDSKFDSRFLPGFAPQLYSLSNDLKLSTNTLAELTDKQEIPLGFIKNSSTDFYIEINGVDNFHPYSVYLIDLKTKHTQFLNDYPKYIFSAEEGDDPNRFVLKVSSEIANPLHPSSKIKVLGVGNTAYVSSQELVEAEICFYSITGQCIQKVHINNKNTMSVDLEQHKGIVLVTIATSDAFYSEKIFIW